MKYITNNVLSRKVVYEGRTSKPGRLSLSPCQFNPNDGEIYCGLGPVAVTPARVLFLSGGAQLRRSSRTPP